MARELRFADQPLLPPADPMLVHHTYEDIDQHAAQMQGFDQHYLQLSRGRFDGVFSSLALASGARLDVEWVAPSLHQRAAVPADTMAIGTFLDLPGEGKLNGQPIQGRTGFVLPAGAAMDLCTPAGTRVAVLTLPLAALRRESDAWVGPRGVPCPIDAAIRLGSVVAQADPLQPIVRPLLSVLQGRPDALGDARIAESVELQLLDCAVRTLHDRCADQPDPRAPARRRHRVFTTARDAIDRADDAESGLSIGALCRLTGVSRRTLEYCFDDVVGLSPRRYLQVLRLNRMRRALTLGRLGQTTVGDVAARHGIWHLGRLSSEYRTMFGELPSATLKRTAD